MNDPYVSYSYIDIKFQLKNGGGTSFFLPDLGLNAYGISDGQDIGCEYVLGLNPYSSGSIQCTLIQGPAIPTASDYAIVRITNYASIFAGISGKRVVFNIPMLSPQCKLKIYIKFNFYYLVSGSSATVNIEIYRVDFKIVKLIKTLSSPLSLSPTSSLDAAGGLLNINNLKTF